MSREDSPATAEDAVPERHDEGLDASAHSGSRWEPTSTTPEQADDPGTNAGDGTPEPAVAAGSSAGTTWWHRDATAPARPRRRGVRIAAGVGAAVLLAGGSFAAGHAVGDGGPDGGPGLVRHHHGGGSRGGPDQTGQAPTGQAPTGQAPTGENTSSSSSPILGGLFT